MIREIAYNLGTRRNQFLEMIDDNEFAYGDDIRSCRIGEPIAILIPYYSKHTILLLPQDSSKESQKVKDERRRLRDLADKF